jgi:hypothetical protein
MGSNTVKDGIANTTSCLEGNQHKQSIEIPEYSQINEKASEEEKSSDERISGNFSEII